MLVFVPVDQLCKFSFVTGGSVLWKMLTYPPTFRALIVGCGMQLFQQLSGINTVMYVSNSLQKFCYYNVLF